MIILLYSIAASAVLIYLRFLVVDYALARVGYNVSAPRAMFDKLPPYEQRATWAHQNSFEEFMLSPAATLLAYVTDLSPTARCATLRRSGLSPDIAFVVARLL